MLDDVAIDRLIQPVLTRQEEINAYIIQMIAKRLREIGTLLPSDIYKLDRLYRYGADIRLINSELARLTGLQVKDIKSIIKAVALDSYIEAKPFYDYRYLSFIPFDKNKTLNNLVNAIARQTSNTYKNLSNTKTMGFIMQDRRNPSKKIFKSFSDAYKEIMDRAVQTVSTGVEDYETVIRNTVKELSDSGVRTFMWESGYTQRTDSAVRRLVLDSVRQISQQSQVQIGREIKADGVELTAHYNPAPDHAELQGRVYRVEEFDNMQNERDFEDITGKHFTAIKRAIGTLNCRHLYYCVVLASNKPKYSEEQLQKILKDNEKGYTAPNGKHYTGYECLQELNRLALKVRHAKDGQIAARKAFDTDLAKDYQRKFDRYMNDFNAFKKACGMSGTRANTTVSGYRRISTKK